MKKVKEKRGRPPTREAKYPVQAKKAKTVLEYLLENGLIESRKQLAQRLEIAEKTLTNWTLGMAPIDKTAQYAFAYLFAIQEAFWSAPVDAQLAVYLGKREMGETQRKEEKRALIQLLSTQVDAFVKEIVHLEGFNK